MRTAFFDELLKLAHEDERIALVVGDLGFSVVEGFAQAFPDRFINAGVAEQNMMGLAAGMASEGYHVFVYSIANFPTFRCAEQIRNDVDYHRLPVTVVAVGGGLAYGNLGYSHHAVQDYGLMRMLPGMLIAAPGDPMEARACVRYLARRRGPAYLRLGKSGEPCLHAGVPEIEPGRWLQVAPGDGGGRTLLTTGGSLALAARLADQGRFAGFALHSLPLWGMTLKAAQPAQVAAWSLVHTMEDHLADCGFGSWMREALADGPADLGGRIRSSALDPRVCGMVGTKESLEAMGGLA